MPEMKHPTRKLRLGIFDFLQAMMCDCSNGKRSGDQTRKGDGKEGKEVSSGQGDGYYKVCQVKMDAKGSTTR